MENINKQNTEYLESMLDACTQKPNYILTKIVETSDEDSEVKYILLTYNNPENNNTDLLQYNFVIRDDYETNLKRIYVSVFTPTLALSLHENNINNQPHNKYIPINEELFNYIESISKDISKHDNKTLLTLLHNLTSP